MTHGPLQGIRFAEKLLTTSAMQSLNVTLHPTAFPPCAHQPANSDAYWLCYVDHLTFTLYHPVGTCKMGPPTDPQAVVDPQLRYTLLTRVGLIRSPCSSLVDWGKREQRVCKGNTDHGTDPTTYTRKMFWL